MMLKQPKDLMSLMKIKKNSRNHSAQHLQTSQLGGSHLLSQTTKNIVTPEYAMTTKNTTKVGI